MKLRPSSEACRWLASVLSLAFALALPTEAVAATFGKTTVGALTANSGFSADVKRCTNFSLGQVGDVSKLTLYTGGVPGYGPSQVVRGVIYATTHGVPTKRMAVSNELRVYEADARAWRTLALPSAVRLTPGRYCLGTIAGAMESAASFNYDSVPGSWFKNSDLYSDGAANPFGTSYETGDIQLSIYATYTAQRCDATLASGETLTAFLDRLPAWGHGCIPGGTYSTSPWGTSLSNFKNGQILKAKLDPLTGRAQKVTLRGSVWTRGDSTPPEVTDVTFEDLTFQGIGDKAFVIFLRGERTRLRYSAVTTSHAATTCGPNFGPPCGQMGIGIGDNAAGWRIERSKIYSNGLNQRFDHGIYCGSARGGVVEGNWLYDNSSYAFHWYPDCDDVDVRYNIADDNGNGMAFAGEGAYHSDRNVLHNGVISNSTQGDPGVTVNCYLAGTGNVARDMDLFPYTGDDCDATELTRSNIVSAAPLYVNPTARDYRLQSGSPARALMGSYATAVPGPRT